MGGRRVLGPHGGHAFQGPDPVGHRFNAAEKAALADEQFAGDRGFEAVAHGVIGQGAAAYPDAGCPGRRFH